LPGVWARLGSGTAGGDCSGRKGFGEAVSGGDEFPGDDGWGGGGDSAGADGVVEDEGGVEEVSLGLGDRPVSAGEGNGERSGGGEGDVSGG